LHSKSAQRGGQRGQVLIEFAMGSSVLFLVIFGIMDFSRALMAYDQVTAAARLGSRYAMVHGSACSVTGCPATNATIQTYVRSKVTGIDPTQLTVTSTWSTAPGCTDALNQGPLCIVNVATSYSFKFAALPRVAIPMTANSQMIISQ
jgi:Flp pilus assembly protein TadG